MADTLLQICQDVAGDIGLQIPTAIVGSSQEEARRLLRSAQRAIRTVGRKHDWQALRGEETITTVASQQAYNLPSDFSYWLPRTHWDRTNYEPMYGPVSPQHWQGLVSSQLAAAAQMRRFFAQRGNQILIYPTPTANGETLAYEYISNHLVLDTDGTTTKRAFAADTDTPRVPQEVFHLFLQAFFLEHQGDSFASELLEAEVALDLAKARDPNYAPYSISPGDGYHLIDEANMPESGYGGV